MDFSSGYHQQCVASDDIEKTAFVGSDRLWESLVVPLGITTAPGWFMRMVANALKEHISKGYGLGFMDDISVDSDSAEEHGRHVRAIMDTLRINNFKVKDKKYAFERVETEFVGYRVTGSGVRIQERKISSIAKWPIVRSPKEVKMFLGLAGAYRKFIPNLGSLAAPIDTLTTSSKAEFDEYMGQHQATVAAAMDKIKRIVVEDPCLALPRKDTDFIVRTDASDFGISTILRQIQLLHFEALL
jgi:hypothetical protein